MIPERSQLDDGDVADDDADDEDGDEDENDDKVDDDDESDDDDDDDDDDDGDGDDDEHGGDGFLGMAIQLPMRHVFLGEMQHLFPASRLHSDAGKSCCIV